MSISIGSIFSRIFSRWMLLIVAMLVLGIKVYERVDYVGASGLTTTIVSEAHTVGAN